MTFIDFKNQCVFNGSDLGKQYNANAIQERCLLKNQGHKQETQELNRTLKPSPESSADNKFNQRPEREISLETAQKNERFTLLEELLKPQLNQGSLAQELMAE